VLVNVWTQISILSLIERLVKIPNGKLNSALQTKTVSA
jgi:hypothetical protein